MPKAAEPRSLTSLREKLVKIGAKVVGDGPHATFQMAAVVVLMLPTFCGWSPAAGTDRAGMGARGQMGPGYNGRVAL